jgi:Fe2+ or Zn2+ uptake regulation protein
MDHDALSQFVAAGTRLTPQRQLIWGVLHQAHDHLTAEEIRSTLEGRLPGVNLPTVYRNLVFLKNLGLVRELHVGDGPVRYEATVPEDRRSHLVCRECRAVEHLDLESISGIAARSAASRGFDASDLDVVVYAVCSNCQAKKANLVGREN